MIGLASSSSHEANVMLSLSWKCLRSFGEVKVQGAVFENGGWWWRCYSCVIGFGIVCICYLEAFESKIPRNARANLEIGFKTQKWQVLRCFWCVSGCFLLVSFLENDLCLCMKKVWILEVVRSTRSHVLASWLVFEVRLTNMVSMHSTKLSRVVTNFKHAYLTL